MQYLNSERLREQFRKDGAAAHEAAEFFIVDDAQFERHLKEIQDGDPRLTREEFRNEAEDKALYRTLLHKKPVKDEPLIKQHPDARIQILLSQFQQIAEQHHASVQHVSEIAEKAAEKSAQVIVITGSRFTAIEEQLEAGIEKVRTQLTRIDHDYRRAFQDWVNERDAVEAKHAKAEWIWRVVEVLAFLGLFIVLFIK